MTSNFFKLACVAAAVLGTAPAMALSDADSAGNCAVSVLSPAADACRGTFAGNNLGNSDPGAAATEAYINATWGLGLDGIAGTSDSFTVNSPADASGAAGFQVNLGSAYSGDFVVALKQANGFSLYFYDNELPTQFITFSTNAGFGGNGNQGISHFTLYGGAVVPGIPEPETYALMVAGLAAVGFVARRRRHG